jgi:hypothetical protein
VRHRLTAALLVAVLAWAATAAAKPEPAADRVQVRGSEFELVLSKRKLTPGRVIVQFLNAGEDDHDLRFQRLDSTGVQVGPELGAGEVEPGAYENIDTRLRKRSTYVLWCSLGDHRERGMEAHLRTRRHRRR